MCATDALLLKKFPMSSPCIRPHPLAGPVTLNGPRAGKRPRGDVATALRQLADQLEANEERLS
jgi:hypothetical protein